MSDKFFNTYMLLIAGIMIFCLGIIVGHKDVADQTVNCATTVATSKSI